MTDVSPNPGASAARRYLLGEADEQECARIEGEYFGNQEAADRIADAEEDLIEDYLDRQLTEPDRQRFERHYLVSPQHRRRLEVVRQLRRIASARQDHAPAATPPSRNLPYGWLAAAAALLVAASAAWFAATRPEPLPPPEESAVSAPSPQPPVTSSPAAPRVFAISLSPTAVRSGGESPTLRAPAGTDLILLRLEGDGGRETFEEARVVVRSVSGEEIWQGPAGAGADLPPGAVAQVEVPAERLPPDDYVVVLFASEGGQERERYRYFLRVLTSSPPGA